MHTADRRKYIQLQVQYLFRLLQALIQFALRENGVKREPPYNLPSLKCMR